MQLPGTSERVPAHTSTKHNRAIAEATRRRVGWHAAHPEAIPQRLQELEREWDIERTLEANAASASLVGTVLGASVDRRFFAVPGIVAAFLLQHALSGWCPPLPIFRSLGVRTQREIDEERRALEALQTDASSGQARARRSAGEDPASGSVR